MLRIKDLDSGKEYNLDKRYTIRDLNTGQLYVLDGDDGPTSPDDPTSPASGRVTDIIQGKQLSLDEFEQVLGLNAVLEAARQRRRGLSASTGALSEASDGAAAPAAATVSGQTEQASSKPAGKQKSSNWLKHRLFNMSKGSLKNMEDEESDATSRASSAADLQASPDHASRMEAGAAASTSGRMGLPTKVMLHKKGSKQYTNLAVVQELYAHTGVIWCMKFSKNGKYVATAGQDGVIRVWEVITQRGQTETQNSCNVKLWHISMDECLRTFKHTDFVTALDFHPADDKFFLSGSIDGKVRMWNIPDQRVVDWADVHEMVTAVNFSPDGAKAIVGTMKGKCRFYLCANFKLEYETQIDVKNKRSGQKTGKKITGMQFLASDTSKLLITSNDSRIRLYDGLRLQCKYKGHSNRNTQIRASFSADGSSIICGSDDGHVYVWSTDSTSSSSQTASKKDKEKDKSSSYECFHAHDDIITVAVFAPDTAHRMMDGQNTALPVATSTLGHVILTAGYSGEVKVFENLAVPATS
ncbi:hypothetical protein WJX79_001633 [Trebouxia sp. C0005]